MGTKLTQQTLKQVTLMRARLPLQCVYGKHHGVFSGSQRFTAVALPGLC